MDEITLRDYRCFRSGEAVPLSPLTLIVGENSTGKTSFLAMVRALWDIAYAHAVPDFNEEPYDLGSFSEIAHSRGSRGAKVDSFEAGFRVGAKRSAAGRGFSFEVRFDQRGGVPFPTVRRVWSGRTSVRAEQKDRTVNVLASGGGTEWSSVVDGVWQGAESTALMPMLFLLGAFDQRHLLEGRPTRKGLDAAARLLQLTMFKGVTRPFASAPVRSKPQRTYNPRTRIHDPEGNYVPMYLADLFRRQGEREWNALKARLESFGRVAGLFDELSIRSFGTREGEPFQVQVRKRGDHTKGPWRNLADVGYGVSQVLPLVTELLRSDGPSMFLLQQPEVHLHPSAQAALGTLFGEVARDRQLIVETHSDHLVNRIRMDVRDGSGWLTPDAVSILYFERNDIEVQIHSLSIDEAGNIVGAPPSYGQFFMEESARSLRY